MPRVKRHAKVHCSIGNHPKTADMFADNDLLATYVRLLLLATERFADRHGDSFIVHPSELGRVTGRQRTDSAIRVLLQLADITPLSIQSESTFYRLTIPNFAKKQGFGIRNGVQTEFPSTPAPTPTSTPSISPPESEQSPQRRKRPGPKRTPRTRFPDPYPDAARDRLMAWGKTAKVGPFDANQIDFAIDSVGTDFRAKHPDEERPDDWVSTIQQWLNRGWALKGYDPQHARQRTLREAEERLKAAREPVPDEPLSPADEFALEVMRS